MKNDVDSFAATYYNWHFQKSLKYCTPESEKWLRFAATNVHQADVDILRAQDEDAIYKIDEITYKDDTTAIVLITVHDFLYMDTIGNAGQILDKAQFLLLLKCRKDKWMVHLQGLPNQISKK